MKNPLHNDQLLWNFETRIIDALLVDGFGGQRFDVESVNAIHIAIAKDQRDGCYLYNDNH